MSSSTDQFWQYAKEALVLALSAKSEDDKQSLLELSQTWTRAAIVERQLRARPIATAAPLAAPFIVANELTVANREFQ